jgi:protein-disulfide isomerase
MSSFLSRRVLLASAAISALAVLAGCSEEKKEAAAPAEAPKAAEPAKTVAAAAPAQPAKPAETAAAAEPAKPTAAEPAKPAAAVELPVSDGDVDMAKALQPGPLKDIFIGKDDAKVTIIEYASMTCPHCAHFHEATLPAIKEKYLDTGKARLVLREFPFDPRAAAAFMLSRCAGDDKYYAMVGTLFQQQSNWAQAQDAKAALLQLSKLAGFSQDSFDKCLTNQNLLNQVNEVRERAAKDFGVESTPTFLINGKKYAGALTVEQMSAVIESML